MPECMAVTGFDTKYFAGILDPGQTITVYIVKDSVRVFTAAGNMFTVFSVIHCLEMARYWNCTIFLVFGAFYDGFSRFVFHTAG